MTVWAAQRQGRAGHRLQAGLGVTVTHRTQDHVPCRGVRSTSVRFGREEDPEDPGSVAARDSKPRVSRADPGGIHTQLTDRRTLDGSGRCTELGHEQEEVPRPDSGDGQ